MTLKNSENNGTEEIGLVTPTPGGKLSAEPMVVWFTNAYMHEGAVLNTIPIKRFRRRDFICNSLKATVRILIKK